MFKLFNKAKKKQEIFACTSGSYIPLNEVKDEVFSKGLIGVGCGIEPKESMIVSPTKGVVTMIFPTKHAIGLKCESGVEIMLHIGLDTVMMKGDGFELQVSENDEVEVGDPIVRVDFDKIEKAGHGKTVLMIVTNTNQLEFKITDNSHHDVHLNQCIFVLEEK